MRRSCVCTGIVFQTLPSEKTVIPITSWQLSRTAGWMNWLMTRLLQSAALPSSTCLAWAIVTRRVGQARCAGALLK